MCKLVASTTCIKKLPIGCLCLQIYTRGLLWFHKPERFDMPPIEARRRTDPSTDAEKQLLERKETLHRTVHNRMVNSALTHPQPVGLNWPKVSFPAKYRIAGQPDDEMTHTWVATTHMNFGGQDPDPNEVGVALCSARFTYDDKGNETEVDGSYVVHFDSRLSSAKVDTGQGLDLDTQATIDLLRDAADTMYLIEQAGSDAMHAVRELARLGRAGMAYELQPPAA